MRSRSEHAALFRASELDWPHNIRARLATLGARLGRMSERRLRDIKRREAFPIPSRMARLELLRRARCEAA